jgi:hypothetical protein
VPTVVTPPVVIDVVFAEPILATVKLALAANKLPVTLAVVTVIELPIIALLEVILLAIIFPVAFTFAKVAFPAAVVEVSVIQLLATNVPSAGQTLSVLVLVLNHSWPLNGLGGGELAA